MWRRFLLLLLCVLIPLKAVMATECDCPHAAEMMGWMVLDASPQHEVHHHHDHGASSHGDDQDGADHLDDHCVGTLGWLLPSALSLTHRLSMPHATPEWLDRPLPAPVLEQPPRPPHRQA